MESGVACTRVPNGFAIVYLVFLVLSLISCCCGDQAVPDKARSYACGASYVFVSVGIVLAVVTAITCGGSGTWALGLVPLAVTLLTWLMGVSFFFLAAK
jgi:hypothetical protein